MRAGEHRFELQRRDAAGQGGARGLEAGLQRVLNCQIDGRAIGGAQRIAGIGRREADRHLIGLEVKLDDVSYLCRNLADGSDDLKVAAQELRDRRGIWVGEIAHHRVQRHAKILAGGIGHVDGRRKGLQLNDAREIAGDNHRRREQALAWIHNGRA